MGRVSKLHISSLTHQLYESEGNVAAMATRLWTERPAIRIVAKEKFFSSKSSRIVLGTIPASYSMGTGVSSRGEKLRREIDSGLHLLPTLRMSGLKPLRPPHLICLYGLERDKFPFTFYVSGELEQVN